MVVDTQKIVLEIKNLEIHSIDHSQAGSRADGDH